jgi:amidase
MTVLELGTDIAGSIRFPAHFCGVYGHKPTHGILTDDGNLRSGECIANDLATAGPMARSPEDLSLMLDVLAGAGGQAAKAWQLALPAGRAVKIQDFRVAMIDNSLIAPIDEAYREKLTQFAVRLRAAGAQIADNVQPSFDHGEAHRAYVSLLRGSGAARLPESVYEAAIEISEKLPTTDTSYAAQLKRAQAQRHRDFILAEEYRARLDSVWATFFEDFDVLLAPVTLSSAFPQDELTAREERKLIVNGKIVDYNDQMFWSGYSTLPSLPVTTIPIGIDSTGLPVGIQVIGPYLEDRTTLAFATAASAIQSFVAPPGFS